MTRSTDLAPHLTTTPPDLGHRQGIVLEWDSITNENVILVAGSELSNVPMLSTGDSIMMSVGDNVLLIKVKSTMFILGRITVPGSSRSFGVRADSVAASGNTTSTSFTDLAGSPGPTVTDVYIGSSKRCLVWVSVAAGSSNADHASAHFAVSGASTIPAPTGAGSHTKGAYLGSPTAGVSIEGSASRTFLLTAADGLMQGLSTFTVKYMSRAGGNASFSNRFISVLPI